MGSSLLLLAVPQGLPEISFFVNFVHVFVSFFLIASEALTWSNRTGWLDVKHQLTYLRNCSVSDLWVYVFTQCKCTLVLLITKPAMRSFLWGISAGVITVLYHLVVTNLCFSVTGLEMQTLRGPLYWVRILQNGRRQRVLVKVVFFPLY